LPVIDATGQPADEVPSSRLAGAVASPHTVTPQRQSNIRATSAASAVIVKGRDPFPPPSPAKLELPPEPLLPPIPASAPQAKVVTIDSGAIPLAPSPASGPISLTGAYPPTTAAIPLAGSQPASQVNATTDGLPVLEVVTDTEPAAPVVMDMGRRPKKRRKKKKSKLGNIFSFLSNSLEFQRTVMLPLVLGLMLWLLLVIVTFFSYETYFFLVVFGFAIFGGGRLMLFAQALDEGMGHCVACLLVPFYPTYYFITRPDRAAGPFVVGCVGILYIASGYGFQIARHWEEIVAPSSGVDEEGRKVDVDHSDDPKCRAMLQDSKCAEALEWLNAKGVNHNFMSWSQKEGIQNVEMLYALGAVKVTMAEIEDVRDGRGSQISWTMIVQLPSKRLQRKELLKCRNRFFPMHENEPDYGQKYMLLNAPEVKPGAWQG
jgi:hypothetical protein